MSHLKIFWHFQNLQRAKLEPSLAFFVFQSCTFFFFTFPFSLFWVLKVCELNRSPGRDAQMSGKCRDCVSLAM